MWSCTLCEEIIFVSHKILALSCGHIFHDKCLTDLISKVETCPVCKSSNNLKFQLFPTIVKDADSYINNADELKFCLMERKYELKEKEKNLNNIMKLNLELENKVSELNKQIESLTQSNKMLRSIITEKETDLESLKEKNEGLRYIYSAAHGRIDKLQDFIELGVLEDLHSDPKQAVEKCEVVLSILKTRLDAEEHDNAKLSKNNMQLSEKLKKYQCACDFFKNRLEDLNSDESLSIPEIEHDVKKVRVIKSMQSVRFVPYNRSCMPSDSTEVNLPSTSTQSTSSSGSSDSDSDFIIRIKTKKKDAV